MLLFLMDSLSLQGDALIARQVEHLSSLEETGPDISELTSVMEGYIIRPLNLNLAAKKDLESLQFLNDVQIKNFLDYRNKYGEFHSIYELKVIDEMRESTPQERFALITYLRESFYGPEASTGRLQRVFKVTQLQ